MSLYRLNVLVRNQRQATTVLLVVVEMFKAHLVTMIQRKSANPYARKTEKA